MAVNANAITSASTPVANVRSQCALPRLYGMAAKTASTGNVPSRMQVRLRAGRKPHSPALVADGNHARVDGFVSVGVIASAALVAVGFPMADPIVGLVITLAILKITWDSWWTVRGGAYDH